MAFRLNGEPQPSPPTIVQHYKDGQKFRVGSTHKSATACELFRKDVFQLCDRGPPFSMYSVWTGCAVQAGCDDLEIVGLAHLYSACFRERFLLSGHHGNPRASDLIRDKALKGRKYIKITDPTVRPFSPSPQSNSQTSAGIFRFLSPLTQAIHLDAPSSFNTLNYAATSATRGSMQAS